MKEATKNEPGITGQNEKQEKKCHGSKHHFFYTNSFTGVCGTVSNLVDIPYFTYDEC
jgi:hypothetical protein